MSTADTAPVLTAADHAQTMAAYQRDGETRAYALGNRGPIRLGADGRLERDILDAYWKHGFYVFENVVGRAELDELRADVERVLAGAPVSPDAELDRHGRPAIGRGIGKIMDRCRDDGYMKIAYKARRALDDAKKTVDVFVDFEPGPQYKLGRLIVQGLDIETEPVIRKLFTLKPGDPYRYSYADRFLADVRDRGIFDNLGETKSKIEVDDARKTVDLTLVFSGEKRPPPKKGLP